MNLRRVGMLILAVTALLALGPGWVMCSSVDTETSSTIYYTGWTPSMVEQTSPVDFEDGTADGTDIATYPGDIVLQSSLEGSFTSGVLDTRCEGALFDHAFWDRTTPAGTSITLEVRANDTLSGGVPAGGWQALGDGTYGSLEKVTGRYVQWRATFTSGSLDDTPVLEEVRIYYRPVSFEAT